MIPIQRLPLRPETLAVLTKRRASATKLVPRAKKIEQHWNYFLRKSAQISAANIAALGDVRAKLDAMFHGKCCYCEKVIAKDIEHFYPKTLYPSRMFDWDNLLRSCKDCNFEKLAEDPDDPMDATGARSLLDPSKDRPEEYLSWDLLTGLPVYIDRLTGVHRGERTVQVCDLDNQKFNDQRRKQAERFLYVLDHVINETPVRNDTRKLLDDLLEPGEPWLGVIRQILRDPSHARKIKQVEKKLPHVTPRISALRWTHPSLSLASIRS